MMGFEIIGVILVAISIVYAFYKKKDKIALGLIIVLLLILYLLGYLS
jgi:apolipoprotein N-acyltransferase